MALIHQDITKYISVELIPSLSLSSLINIHLFSEGFHDHLIKKKNSGFPPSIILYVHYSVLFFFTEPIIT